MDTLAQLLVVLFCLSALYAVLGALAHLAGDLARRSASRPWRALPGRRIRRRPRRRIERDERGVSRRPNATDKVPVRALTAH
jgi:hypothetical protein